MNFEGGRQKFREGVCNGGLWFDWSSTTVCMTWDIMAIISYPVRRPFTSTLVHTALKRFEEEFCMGWGCGQGIGAVARSILICREWSFPGGRRSFAWGSLDEGNTWERSKNLGAEYSLYFYSLSCGFVENRRAEYCTLTFLADTQREGVVSQ